MINILYNKFSKINIKSTQDLSIIKKGFDKLMYVPNRVLKNKIIKYLCNYLQKKFKLEDYKIRVFIVEQGEEIIGIVVAQIDEEYKSYGRKCGTFGWLYSRDFETCELLMDSCEKFMKNNGIRKIRGPINFPKMIGGIGFQIKGFKHKMISGVSYNSQDSQELSHLKKKDYKIESKYTCVHVTNDNWKKGNKLASNIELKYLTLSQMKQMKIEMMKLAKNTFHTILADASGGAQRLEEFFKLYDLVPKSHYNIPQDFNPKDFTNNSVFIDVINSCDLENVVTWAPFAFDKQTDELVGFIFSLPNLYQIWQKIPLTDANVDTVMIRKDYAGKGIFSALNNIGRVVVAINGINYVEGTSIWSNNELAVNTIFPHSKPIRTHVVLQKRIKS